MLKRGLVWPLFLLLVAVAARRWFDVVEVRGRSMMPVLLPRDRLVATRLGGPPRAGEIVLTPDPRDPSRELIKRVTAVDASGVTLRGDNADLSTDGRVFGAIPVSSVRWRVVARFWPAGRIGLPRRP